MQKWNVVVRDISVINPLVKQFRFECMHGNLLPAFSGGAHIMVEMNHQDRVFTNPYSLISSPLDRSHYIIAVRRDNHGRGGSLFMHQNVAVGDQLTVRCPVNRFALNLHARKHLMFAGGIGITPFLAQMAQLSAADANFELVYRCRNHAFAPYADDIRERYGERIHIYYDEQKDRMDLASVLSKQVLGTHVYVCGPRGLIDAVCTQANTLNWPEQAIHTEEFVAPPTGKAFNVQLNESNKTITVAEHQSLLEAIEAAGVDTPYFCRGGACGQCETNVLRCTGSIMHNDHWLTPQQRQSNKKIMPCVSRFEGKVLVLDR